MLVIATGTIAVQGSLEMNNVHYLVGDDAKLLRNSMT